MVIPLVAILLTGSPSAFGETSQDAGPVPDAALTVVPPPAKPVAPPAPHRPGAAEPAQAAPAARPKDTGSRATSRSAKTKASLRKTPRRKLQEGDYDDRGVLLGR